LILSYRRGIKVEKQEMTITKTVTSFHEQLQQLEKEILQNTSVEGKLSARALHLIDHLGEADIFNIIEIISSLLEEQLETGEIKGYTKGELLERLPWKKSRLTERLQLLVGQGILEYQKRRYNLNNDCKLVIRVRRALRLQYEEFNWEELIEEFAFERTGKVQEKKVEERTEKHEKKNLYRKITKNELEYFLETIYQTYQDNLIYCHLKEEQIEELAKKIEKEILLTVGLTTRKSTKKEGIIH